MNEPEEQEARSEISSLDPPQLVDPYDIEVPNTQRVGFDQVISVDGMVLGGARRIRYAVQSRVESSFKQLLRFIQKSLPVLVLGYLTYSANQVQVQSDMLVRKKEFVCDFYLQYTIIVSICLLAGEFRRQIRESLYFATMITYVVFQSISLYRFHHLDDGLEQADLSEESPQPLAGLYLAAYLHELCFYLLAFCGLTCVACGLSAICYEQYQRRVRRRQLGGFPEYREEDFNGPDLARADSINKRVTHLEQIKVVAKE